MDFDDAKENIQPLAQGRNASILQASLKVDSGQELMAQRKELEREIHNYSGDDPLSAWYNYIDWIEQSFPSGGKESGLQEVLAKCLSRFESDEHYNNDRRMIKLYIKYIDNHKDPAECYQQLFNAGIGTMVSDFYIAWAYCYDLINNTRKADEIFRRGIACRAQPLEELQEAHQHFGFTVAQRLMYKDDDNVQEETSRQMHERRLALSSLRGHRRRQMVGSVRTGSAVKNAAPGIIKNNGTSSTHQRNNVRVDVFKDENQSSNFIVTSPTSGLATNTAKEESKSVVRTIIDAQRDQENRKEPGPWNKPHAKGKLFGKLNATNELGFEIHKDDEGMDVEDHLIVPITMTHEETKFDKPLRLPKHFCARNTTLIDWIVPVTTEVLPDRNTLPEYNKCKLYPRPNVEFQPEELKGYRFLKKRGIESVFTKKRDEYWGRGPLYNVRQYPHFSKQSNTQHRDALDEFYVPAYSPGFQVSFKEIYNVNEQVERQFEEILATRLRRNETIIKTTDMEETICVSSDKMQRRKSFFPMRKSIAPCANSRPASRKCSVLAGCAEDNESKVDERVQQIDAHSTSALPIFEDRDKVQTPKILSNLPRQCPPKEPITKSAEVLVTGKGATPKLFATAGCAKETEGRDECEKQMTTKCSSAFPIFEDRDKFEPPKVLSKLEHIQAASQGTTKPTEPSQINQEESFVSRVPKTILPPKEPEQNDQAFQFKAPALPASANAPAPSAKPNKIQFEIFEDNANNVPSVELGCGSGGYFDGEETCSTQTFNIFLKAQSVSTPQMKPEPQRKFGKVLRESVPQPIFEQNDEELQRASSEAVSSPLTDIGDENNTPAAATLFSPQRKQLSTILETSEHGTTQSTHTTGATTKSTISSPEFDQDSQAQTMTTGGQHQPTLETVKERTVEDSITPTPDDNIDVMLNSMKIATQKAQPPTAAAEVPTARVESTQPAAMGGRLDFSIFEDTMDKNSKQNAQSTLATPGVARFPPSSGGRLDFSIFEDTMDTKNAKKQHVGNFSRLEEKEDTEAGFAIKPIRFQEDKTETISKMLLAPPQPVKFQEDKTETISKMLLAPPQVVKYQEDKTETISRMFSAPPQPVRFEEDKTETISKFIFAPPQPSKYEEEMLPKLPSKETSIKESKSQDNFFEFFSQSPPKDRKSTFTKPSEKASHLRAAADSRTPIAINPKRVCDNDTPDMQKLKTKTPALFADPKPKSVLRDSFIPDLTMDTTDTQTKQQQQQQSKNFKPKSVLRDSFIPDFSLTEDIQPQKPVQKQHPKPTDESFLPDFTHIPETQHISNASRIADSQPVPNCGSRMKQNSIKSTSALQSYLPDFSHIPQTQQPISDDSIIADSQPIASAASRMKQNSIKNTLHDSIIPDSQPMHSSSSSSRMKQNSIKNTLQSSFLPDFSMMPETQPLTINSGEGQPATMKHLLTDTFMKDFSEIREPPPIPMDVKEMTMVQPSKNNSTLKYLEESLNQKPNETISKPSSSGKLSFLAPNPIKSSLGVKKSGDDKFFELNAETEMFGTNISMIKNSTWLPNHGPRMSKNLSQIQEDSIHIKNEELSSESTSSFKRAQDGSEPLQKDVSQVKLSQSSSISKTITQGDLSAKVVVADLPKPKLSFLDQSKNMMNSSRFSIDVSQSEWAAINAIKLQQQQQQQQQHQMQSNRSMHTSVHTHAPGNADNDDDDFGEMSIYYKHTPKTPKAQVHVWEVPEEDVFKTPSNNRYMHVEADLNQTHQLIENICVDPNVNPFNVDLINAFLEQVQFISYIQGLPHCMMVRSIHRLKNSSTIRVHKVEFEVLKLIGEGAYGAVFCGKHTAGGQKVAMKQENPANLWEFYICLEIQDRILVDEMLPAYMSIDYALIGNNSSILISQFSKYGSLITVCNKIKKQTMKNVDEYVVMLMASELLEIIDHLHAVSVIHADIKADNFLLMNKLSYPSKERCLQLIDFGVSIDMKQYKSNQTFSYVHNDNSFKCVEMREERPWTYQLDLYGLAGVLHVLLFGKYMDIEKKPSGIWMHKTHTPRYFNKNLWDTIFKSLLNIRDCNSMPNLQNLRALLKEEMEEKEKYVLKMVNEFNRALES